MASIAGEATRPAPADPKAEYERRLRTRRAAAAALEARERQLGNARLVVAAIGLGIAWLAVGSRSIAVAWIGLPLAGFLALVILHDGVIRQRAAALRIVRYYERGLARLEDRWQGQGPTGEEYRNASHPSSGDLDLFGRGSLFELVCTARSREGERALASWLTAPAAPEVVRSRQDAVRDLAPRLDLREDLAGLGEELRGDVRTEEIARWGTEGSAPIPVPMLIFAGALAAATLGALGLWVSGGSVLWLVGAVVAGQLFLSPYTAAITRTLRTSDRLDRDIALFARLLQRLEAEEFTAPRLRELRAGLERTAVPPSARLARLERILAYQQSQKNGVFAIFAFLMLMPAHLAAAIDRWRAENGAHLARWITAAAELEALSALGAYSYEHPSDIFPEIVEQGPLVEVKGLGHPLLPEARAVRNDLSLGTGTRLLVVSGSNMSGKSTLLRALGVNVVLALAGAPVRAVYFRVSPLAIGTSIRIQDSLQSGASHFYAEITRLRQVVDLADGSPPLLFMLDEILHGTNSHDRRIGAEAVLRTLVARGAIGLVTTHDLALTRIVDDPALQAVNVHFEDHLEDGKMSFDYRLLPGVVHKSNALELMRAVGLDV